MIFLAILFWAALAIAYLILVAGVVWACIAAYRRRALWNLPSRMLPAVLAGLLLGPPGCAVLNGTWVSETGEELQPPIAESRAIAYWVPFALGFLAVLIIPPVTGWHYGGHENSDV